MDARYQIRTMSFRTVIKLPLDLKIYALKEGCEASGRALAYGGMVRCSGRGESIAKGRARVTGHGHASTLGNKLLMVRKYFRALKLT